MSIEAALGVVEKLRTQKGAVTLPEVDTALDSVIQEIRSRQHEWPEGYAALDVLRSRLGEREPFKV